MSESLKSLKNYKKQLILGPIFKLTEAVFELIVPLLMAYIIEKDDFEVKKYPKRTNLLLNGDKYKKNQPCVEIEEIDSPLKNKTLNVNITFQPYHSKLEFEFDTFL